MELSILNDTRSILTGAKRHTMSIKEAADLKESQKPIVINLGGGPCTGKTIQMARLFCILNIRGYNCKMAPEFASELVNAKEFEKLKNQKYVFDEQYRRINMYRDVGAIVVTDSPLFMSMYYAKQSEEMYQVKPPEGFNELVKEKMNEFNNLNYHLIRTFPFKGEGRTQKDENEAIIVDNGLIKVYQEHNIPYKEIEPNELLIKMVLNDLKEIMPSHVMSNNDDKSLSLWDD